MVLLVTGTAGKRLRESRDADGEPFKELFIFNRREPRAGRGNERAQNLRSRSRLIVEQEGFAQAHLPLHAFLGSQLHRVHGGQIRPRTIELLRILELPKTLEAGAGDNDGSRRRKSRALAAVLRGRDGLVEQSPVVQSPRLGKTV